MPTLTQDTPRTYEVGNINAFPVIADDALFEGAAVGDNGSGYARPLVAGDRFLGFAEEQTNNINGAAGDIRVRVKNVGLIILAVSGAVITDVGQPVYASDDDTFTLDAVGNSYIGLVYRWESSGVVVVAFVAQAIDGFGDNQNRELISDDKTLDAEDTGKIFYIDTDAKTITLPVTATPGQAITFVNAEAFGTVAVNISPAAADKIMGPDLPGVDNKDLILTKETAKRGDYVVLTSGHADGWTVSAMKGMWAAEA